jgi:phosphohistidine phosphatase SixA
VPLLVVRHARAGKRREWQGDDRLRPLDEKGRRQAGGLPALLARFEIARIASSPYLRCMQTVEPLGEQRGLTIQERDELEEGASLDATLALLRELGDNAVLCTHGDVLLNLFGEAGQKGSTRVAELREGTLAVLEYLQPLAAG